jgi:hypothetical protein
MSPVALVFILRRGAETNHKHGTAWKITRARANSTGKTTRSISLAIRQTQEHEAPYSRRMRLSLFGVDNKCDHDRRGAVAESAAASCVSTAEAILGRSL